MTNKYSPRETRLMQYLADKRPYIKRVDQLHYLRERGITVRECNEVLGTTELRKVVSNLIRKGVPFISVWEEDDNKFGELCRYKRYFLTF